MSNSVLSTRVVAHGSNPQPISTNEIGPLLANKHGILFNICGHPNIRTRTAYISDAAGAQTDSSILGTISAGTRIVLTSVAVTVDSAVTATGGVSVKLGFGASTIPADSASGADGIILDHKGISAGSGIVIGNGSGIIGIGSDGEEFRLTCEDPVGGGLSITVTYFTIEA